MALGILRGMDDTDKVRENHARRAVARMGYALEKSRRRDSRAWEYGTYQIVDYSDDPSGVLVYSAWGSGRGWGLTLDDVERWLTSAGKPTVEVILESESSDTDRLAVANVFESAGIWADVKGAYIRRSAGALPWIIEIVVGGALVKFLWAAVSAAGDEAGRNGWKAFMGLVARLYEARKASKAAEGGVTITDRQTGAQILLPPGLPEEAYHRLFEIETVSAPLSGVLRWDNDAQDWTDVFTGQFRCMYLGCTADATQSRSHHPSPTVMLNRLLCNDHADAVDAGDLTIWKHWQ